MQSIRAVATTAAEIAASIRGRYLASTGLAIYHSLRWLTTKLQDVSYKNPDFQPPTIADAVQAEGIGIYCVHGTADNMAAFEDAARYLMEQGLPSAVSSVQLVAFENRARGVGIEDFAKQLLAKILANGHKTVILVGHSRGGLVNAYLYEYLAREAGVNVMFSFSISAPYRGSDLALPPLSWVSKSVQEMQKNSEFLKNLHKKHDKSHHYVCVTGDSDYIVKMQDANFNAAPAVVFSDQGHLSVLHDLRLLRLLRNTIRDEVNKLVPREHQSSAAKLKEDEEYTHVELQPIPELWDIYFEISMYIEDFKCRIHIYNTDDKVSVFETLQQRVEAILEGKQSSDAKTFGEFIEAFLVDKSKSESIPNTIIDQQLNSPLFWMFSTKDTHSRTFVNRLKTVYSNVVLPLSVKTHQKNKEEDMRIDIPSVTSS